MARTLLQIIQTSQAELGLPQSDTVIGNTDVTTQQLLAFANATLDEIGQYPEEGWTFQQREFNLVVDVPIETTGDITENSAVVTNIPDTSALTAGGVGNWYVSGDSIPQGCRILSIDSATQITLTMEATGTETAADFTFALDTYDAPSNIRWFQNRTWWDRTNRWELLGPDSPQIDQWHRSGIVTTGPRRHWRQIGAGLGATLRLWPPPNEISNPLQLVWEFMSTDSVYVHGVFGTYTQYFENDDDIPLFDDRAIILGVKWRFWEQKGFNWTVKRTEYDMYVERMNARDGASPTLDLVSRVNPIFISPANVQDGFFPGPVGPNV